MGDSEREYSDLKAKMKSQRLSFYYKLKGLEKKLADFSQSILDEEEEEEQKELAREVKQIEKDIRRGLGRHGETEHTVNRPDSCCE